MSESYDLDSWLNNGKKFEKKQFLTKWKERPSRKVNLFLHTNAPVVEIFRHSFYRVAEMTDKDTKVTTRKLLFTQLVCHEDLAVSRRQNKRDDGGNRTTPPVSCPLCMIGEWARTQVREGKLRWTDPLFELSAGEQRQVIRVGALYNAFGGDKLNDQQKADLRANGLEPSEAWKQNHMAKGAVVFRAVDFDELDKGVQIAIETTLVGDCIKKVIRDARESLGEMDGDPRRNPYCIQLQYNDREPVFGKKYEARLIQRIKPTPEVLNLIQNTEAPDLGNVIEPFDAAQLRISLEKAALVKGIPFDRIFANAKKSTNGTKVDTKSENVDVVVTSPMGASSNLKQQVDLSPKEELFECDTDGCKGLLKRTDMKCLECSRIYDLPKITVVATKKRGVAAIKHIMDDDENISNSDDLPF